MRNDIITLIQTFVKKVANLTKSRNYYRQRCISFKHTLKIYGLLNHGSINVKATSASAIYRRLCNIKKTVNHHDNTVSDLIDLTSTFALSSVRKNETASNIVRSEIRKHCIREQNILTKQLNDDHEYNARIFFTGFLRGWSKRDYDNWNKTVKLSIQLLHAYSYIDYILIYYD